MSDKTIIITITIYPFEKNKRRVLVAGAPQGEMPIARPGLFHELHDLVDQLWLDLAERKPQTVHVKKGAPAAAGVNVSDETAAPESDAAQDLGAETADPSILVEAHRDAPLPTIQGDDTLAPISHTGDDPDPSAIHPLLPTGEEQGMRE